MNKTPRELNTAYDLAQQKIIHLKARNYCFDPLNAVMHDWVANPDANSCDTIATTHTLRAQRRQS